MSQDKFLQTQMTPRAWRMLAYSCIGIFAYGIVLGIEAVQNLNLSRIDRQLHAIELQEIESQKSFSAEISTPAAATPKN